MARWNALVTVPQSLRQWVVRQEALDKLAGFCDVTLNESGANWGEAQLAERIGGIDVVIASWGLAKLDESVMARADRLKFVGYGAGSVKGFALPPFWAKGCRLSHAAFRIADSVAEYTLTAAMMGLRRLQDYDRRCKAGEAWPKAREDFSYEIRGMQVGLLGLGYVGRRTAAIFQALGAEVWAYDPYLSAERASELGVHKAELDDLLANCPVVSVHLPVTPETHHLLGARELAIMRDDAVLINSARDWTVDQDAMLAELESGRIWAALDVYDPEPLPVDHPLRKLDNVLLTPHIAGHTQTAHLSLMGEMIDEAERLYKGEPLQHEVTQEMLATMA